MSKKLTLEVLSNIDIDIDKMQITDMTSMEEHGKYKSYNISDPTGRFSVSVKIENGLLESIK